MKKITHLFENLLRAAMVLLSFHAAAQPVFVPNQGQWEGDFLFKTKLTSGALFFEENGYTALLMDPEAPGHGHNHGTENHSHAHSQPSQGVAYKMTWLNTSPKASPPKGFSEMEFYHNYLIGNDPARWKSGVPVYSGINYDELYTGVSVNYYEAAGNLKYDIHLSARADVSQIAMQYEGVSNLSVEEGRLIINTTIGAVTEYIPEAYQIINGQKKLIPCKYQVDGNTVGFILSNYDASLPVVIDPILEFSTFSGSTADNWGFTATYDDAGHFYGGGIVFGSGYPSTTGAFQPSYGGGDFDVAISKFSPDGKNLLYATFIGGSSIDMPHSMIVDNSGNLIILGSTGSSNFPMVSNGYQSTISQGNPVSWDPWNAPYQNGANTFVVRLNSAGSSMLSGTFLGSTNGAVGTNIKIAKNYCDETRGEVIVLNNGNIAITTSSTAPDLPFLKPGSGPGVNSQNAIVAVFNPALTQLVWGSYYGGTNHETGNSIKTDGTYVFICGATESSDLPMHSNAFQSSHAGGIDGYIARFNGSNGQFTAATYIGTQSYDQAFFIDIDKFGSVLVFGQSQGSMPVTSGQYSNIGSRQFLQKYPSNLDSRLWATVVGSGTTSKTDFVPTAFMVDKCLNIYISGWGGSTNIQHDPTKPPFIGGNTNGLPVTPDAIQSNTDGSDFYFMVLDRDASGLLYGSFYGGSANEHVDGGTSRFSPEGVIYQAVCASCGGITTTFPTTPGVYSSTNPPDNCNLGAIKIDLQPTVQSVPLIDFDNDVDTTCDKLIVKFTNNSFNGNRYYWDFGNGLTSTQFEPTSTFEGLGTYFITLVAVDTVCDISDTAIIQIDHNKAHPPVVSLSSDYMGCDTSYRVAFSNTSSEVNQFLWDFGDGQTSTDENPTHFYADSGMYQVTLIAKDTSCFLSDTIATQITFTDSVSKPEVKVDYRECSSGEVEASHTDYRERYLYEWTYIGKKAQGAHPDIKFDKPGYYLIYLNIEDPICNRKYEQEFKVKIDAIQQETTIPNAFTPNGDGLNEEFMLSGNICNPKDYFRIFNRWGQVVFATEKPFDEFWDGSFEGEPAKEDVYTYILKTGNELKRGYLTLFR